MAGQPFPVLAHHRHEDLRISDTGLCFIQSASFAPISLPSCVPEMIQITVYTPGRDHAPVGHIGIAVADNDGGLHVHIFFRQFFQRAHRPVHAGPSRLAHDTHGRLGFSVFHDNVPDLIQVIRAAAALRIVNGDDEIAFRRQLRSLLINSHGVMRSDREMTA